MAWSIIGTPAHKGDKTRQRMAVQWVQHQVEATDLQAVGQWFTAYGTNELCNVEHFH